MGRIVVDTEWTSVPWSASANLLWIGLADETGRSWCGLMSDAHIDPEYQRYVSDLLRLATPNVAKLPRTELATAVEAFCGSVTRVGKLNLCLELTGSTLCASSQLGLQKNTQSLLNSQLLPAIQLGS
jgi:hypothetical protein